MRFTSIPMAFIALGVAALASQAYGQASAQALKATLSGPAEKPAGDPQGSGTASFQVDPAKGEVCYTLQVSKIAPATMAHIHKAPPGAAGPVVVPLAAPDASGKSAGCAKADAAVLTAIQETPSDYYVNVHNAAFPGGAVRGQLTK